MSLYEAELRRIACHTIPQGILYYSVVCQELYSYDGHSVNQPKGLCHTKESLLNSLVTPISLVTCSVLGHTYQSCYMFSPWSHLSVLLHVQSLVTPISLVTCSVLGHTYQSCYMFSPCRDPCSRSFCSSSRIIDMELSSMLHYVAHL